MKPSQHPGPKKRPAVLPFLFRAFPRTSARYLANQFLKPRQRLPGIQTHSEHRIALCADGVSIVAEIEGDGPLVILAHGWAGSGEQFKELKARLLSSGFRVATFDAPGHGSSPGNSSNAGQFARLIAELHRQHGPTLAIVGHSLGGLAAAMSRERVKPAGLVLVCPMPSFEFALDQYQAALRFGANVRERIARRVEQETQVTRDRGRIEHGLRPDVRTLLLHDELDRVIPVSASRALKERFQHVQYIETHGLGHSRLLRDDGVLTQVTAFLQSLALEQRVAELAS